MIKTKISIESRDKVQLKVALLEILDTIIDEEHSEDMDYSCNLTTKNPPYKFHLNNSIA